MKQYSDVSPLYLCLHDCQSSLLTPRPLIKFDILRCHYQGHTNRSNFTCLEYLVNVGICEPARIAIVDEKKLFFSAPVATAEAES